MSIKYIQKAEELYLQHHGRYGNLSGLAFSSPDLVDRELAQGRFWKLAWRGPQWKANGRKPECGVGGGFRFDSADRYRSYTGQFLPTSTLARVFVFLK